MQFNNITVKLHLASLIYNHMLLILGISLKYVIILTAVYSFIQSKSTLKFVHIYIYVYIYTLVFVFTCIMM